MIVAQVFLEAMEGCHLLLGPLFVMQTAIFRICPSAVVQIFAAVCFKESRSLVPSAIVGRLSCFVSSASLDCFRPVLAVALNRCSFSSGAQPKFFFLAAFGSTFLCGQFSHSPETALFFLSSFTGTFESCLFPVSSKALFPLLGCFQGSPLSLVVADNFQALFPFLPGLLGQFGQIPLAVCLQSFLSFGSTLTVHASPGLFFCVSETLLWRPCILLVMFYDPLLVTSFRETTSTRMNSLEKTDDSSRHLCAMSQQHFGALFTMLADKVAAVTLELKK